MVTHLLKISAHAKGGILGCCHSRGDTEGMGDSGVVISLITGPGLDGHPDSGHGAIVLQGGDGQPIGEGGHLQRLCLDQLPLSLGHGLGSECSLGSCLKSTITSFESTIAMSSSCHNTV